MMMMKRCKNNKSLHFVYTYWCAKNGVLAAIDWGGQRSNPQPLSSRNGAWCLDIGPRHM